MMTELYDNLMALTSIDSSKFFFKDLTSPYGTRFRIFSYHFASYSDWLNDDALECRGVMFEMDDDGPVRIASRPMEKFFNLDETPFTMNLDFSKIELALAKEDGSLISSYVDTGRLCFKSKTSMYSGQAVEAVQWISRAEHNALFERVLELAKTGYTCNFEFVAPTNRIVLEYQEKALVLLNVRHNDTGEYVSHSELFKDGILRPYLVKGFDIDLSAESVEEIRSMEGIEGFIFQMSNGLKFKLKTRWYSALHNTKDSINNNQRLFETIAAGASDDLKGMFAGDDYAIRKVEIFEEIHREFLTSSIARLEELYPTIAGRDRKDYAVTAQTVFKDQPGLFSIIMQAYTGGLNYDTLIDQLNKVFLKISKGLVPEEYATETKIFEE